MAAAHRRCRSRDVPPPLPVRRHAFGPSPHSGSVAALPGSSPRSGSAAALPLRRLVPGPSPRSSPSPRSGSSRRCNRFHNNLDAPPRHDVPSVIVSTLATPFAPRRENDVARRAAASSGSATIKDVARAAGVSVATVSRVLNESGPVREETRRRVWEVASSLRYVPNETARSLITRSTRTLGVVLPDLHGEFFSEVIRGIDQRAQRERYHLLVSGSHNEREEIEAALRAMRRRVDGLVLMSPDIDAAGLEANLPHDLPVVLLNCAIRATAVPTITIDNFGGATAMVRHLLSLGHRRIGFIGGPPGNYDAAERLRGYRETMRAAGLDPSAWEEVGDFTESGGHGGA
ncbi:MAG: LacI family DNA-binding transcriptional regulator, partial [Gemmatimonadetes bacterium]|nr:LacI family DNA-binding transcriptional regulator [Gemmatimonadota bacterium]